jgi:thiamine pyrophosphokinase
MSTIAVVVGGGPVPRPDVAVDVDGVIAADSGLDRALEAGFVPTVLVGDLDSISSGGVRWAREHGIPIVEHSPDKDDTDTALALGHAAASGHDRLLVLGPASVDRLDHQLGTIIALGAPELGRFETVTAHLGDTVVHAVHPGHAIDLGLTTGATFSLLALHGTCTGVEVTGARWPLRDAELRPGRTLGISNEALGAAVRIAVDDGVLTVVIPPATTTGMAA